MFFFFLFSPSFNVLSASDCIEQEFTKAHLRHISGSYRTSRNLLHYVEFFKWTDFYSRLTSLSLNQHWIDMGAGKGDALYLYALTRFLEKEHSTERSQGSFPYLTAVGVNINNIDFRPLDKREWTKKFKYLRGYIERIDLSDLREADVITDVLGPFTYSRAIDEVLVRYLKVLENHGKIYIHTSQNTEIIFSSPPSKDSTLGMHRWLSMIDGITFSYNDRNPYAVAITIEDRSKIRIPKLKLIHFKDAPPPDRKFEVSNEFLTF